MTTFSTEKNTGRDPVRVAQEPVPRHRDDLPALGAERRGLRDGGDVQGVKNYL